MSSETICRECQASKLVMKQYAEIRAERKINDNITIDLDTKCSNLKKDKITRCDTLNKTRQQYIVTLQIMIEERNLKLDKIKMEINKKTSEKINNLLATTDATLAIDLLSQTYDAIAAEYIPEINTMTIEIQEMLSICKKIDADIYYLNRFIVPTRDGRVALEIGDEQLETIIKGIESTESAVYKYRSLTSEIYKKEAALSSDIRKAEHHLSVCKKMTKPVEKEDDTDSTSVTSDGSETNDD